MARPPIGKGKEIKAKKVKFFCPDETWEDLFRMSWS
jgi:hypothetical protein